MVWGENLPSLVGCGRLSSLSTANIRLPQYQFSVIIGLILSDGHLFYAASHTKSVRLCFEQSYKHKDYLYFVFLILSHYCSIFPYQRIRSRRVNSNHSIVLTSRGLFCFNELYSIFHVNKVKIIPTKAPLFFFSRKKRGALMNC